MKQKEIKLFFLFEISIYSSYFILYIKLIKHQSYHDTETSQLIFIESQ